jgi:hypothetical protein
LGSIRTPKISGLILRHELLSPLPRNFQRGNLLYKLVSSTNLGLDIPRSFFDFPLFTCFRKSSPAIVLVRDVQNENLLFLMNLVPIVKCILSCV